MDALDWIDSLARQARREIVPDLHASVPRVEPPATYLPRAVLSLSAFGSLAAACVLLVMGLHAQRTSTTPVSPSVATTTDNSSVLFSPVKMELQ
jgi:hypothetical protein